MLKHPIQSLIAIVRVIIFRFEKNLCFLRASALAFNTALSVVPLLAVMFGVAKGFGIEPSLEEILQNEFRDQKEVIQYLIQFGRSLLEQSRGGLIAGIGIITLFYTVLLLFSNIENSLNSMWGKTIGRSFLRKATDYIALVIICPIVFVASSSVTVFVTTYIETLKDSILVVQKIQPFVLKCLSFIPFLMSTFLFTFLYIFIPNVRVKWTSALFAGVLAGIAFQFLQTSYISIQLQLSKTDAVYGSFAAIPLFLVWLYFSWLIFLIGAEIVIIHQERQWDHHLIAPYRTLSGLERKIAILCVVKSVIDAFTEEQIPISNEELAKRLRMPVRLVCDLVEDLIDAHILIQTTLEDERTIGVAIAKNPDRLHLFDILKAIDGENHLVENGDMIEVQVFEKQIQEGMDVLLHSDKNISIGQLFSRSSR
jgi:membrane protein